MGLMIAKKIDTETTGNLPSLPGTYVLVLATSVYREITIGSLGALAVQPGFYVYVGSAMGPGGLAARVNRHCQHEKRLRWHVDYLRAVAQIDEVWYATGKRHQECRWAHVLRRMPGASVPMPRFGASDCRCPSHLLFFTDQPSLDDFRQKLRGQDIHRWRRLEAK